MRDTHGSAPAYRRLPATSRERPTFGLARVAVLALAASTLGACSGDTMRFADPFGTPFGGGREPVMTGSVPDSAAPTMSVESAPLAAPGGGFATASAGPMPTQTSPQVIAATPMPATPAPVRTANGRPGWTAAGGTAVVVREGETLATLAGRYNVPADAIQTVNGLTSPSEVRAGRSIVIPVYDATGGAAVASAAPARPAQTAAAPAAEPVRTGSLSSPPLPPTPPARTVAARTPAGAPAPTPAPAVLTAAPAAAPAASAPAASAPAASAPRAQMASLPSSSSLDFRWPARGRVISGFGTAGNEGINIAVPEGTPVRAAEGGTVAYAGEELRGYGKLVLIRHADGYVSAYAHNSSLQVRQGEEVRRGQVIAQSGRTGNVTSPQLHFEIRQGATPVDPMPYLTN